MIKKNLVELAKTFVSKNKNRKILQYINFTEDGYIEATDSIKAIRISDKDNQYNHLKGLAINPKTLESLIEYYPKVNLVFDNAKDNIIGTIEEYHASTKHVGSLGKVVMVEIIMDNDSNEVIYFKEDIWEHLTKTLNVLNQESIYLCGKKSNQSRTLYIKCDEVELLYLPLMKFI